MGRKWFAELIQYLELLLPQLMARRVDGACFVRLRVGEFDDFANQWGIQLRFPQMERKKASGSRRSIYQARTQRLFLWDNILGNPSDGFLKEKRIYGQSLFPYYLNATAGMRHDAEPIMGAMPLLGLDKWINESCKKLGDLDIDRLYLSHFASEIVGIGDFLVARRLDGDPSQLPSRHNGSLSKAGLMLFDQEADQCLCGLVAKSELEEEHTTALNNVIRQVKPAYSQYPSELKLLKSKAIRDMRGAGGYSHC